MSASSASAPSTANTASPRNIFFAYYPIRGTCRLAKLARSVHPHTISSNAYAFERFFTTSSVACRYCDKPVVHISDIDTCYSIIRPCFCPGGLDETTDDFKHNQSVAAILPQDTPTVCGAVLVFKHPPCDDDIPGGTLPLLDMETSDLEVTDEIMRRWIQSLFEPQELPPNTFVLPPPLP
ncbi:hypothetical protein C8F01DRAFT_1261156 [Mycena amicta]|nr:hypothetical protein C8F01DRAFT_1261156 [Mycena amicta]